MSEFDLIRRYFTHATPDAELGVGDDAALLSVSEGNTLVVSSDMLVSGTHFFADTDPFMLGHKTLAVNLSDMAAMGAKPRWATLAISLPKVNHAWLSQFSAGFFALAKQHDVNLVGGDTTRGSLNLCVTMLGEVPRQSVLLRSGASVADEIWVSGQLGDAALALAHMQQKINLSHKDFSVCAQALHQPQPRVALGIALRGIASSAIDISDGLLADLGHMLKASQVGAQLKLNELPCSSVMAQQIEMTDSERLSMLSAGDDYELCFTVPAVHHNEVLGIARSLDLKLTCIGEIIAEPHCIVHDANGVPLNNIGVNSYDHFR